MSGPWVLMRAEALAQIIDGWYFQEFLGNRCTYGDDRHISTLMLELGMESLFCPDSFVLTDCPIDWKVFIKQQLRWNKSFNRENLILLTFIHKMSKFVQTDVVYQQTFPFIMLYILANLSTQAAGISLEAGLPAGLASVLPYAGLVVAYNELFFGIYGAFKNRDINYLKSPVYIGYHFGRLLWLKLEAIIKAKDAGWGTKDESLDPPSEEQLDLQIDEIERLVDEAINSVGFKPKAKGGAQTATEATKAGSTVNSKGPDHTDDGGAGYSEAQAEM